MEGVKTFYSKSQKYEIGADADIYMARR